MRATEPPKETNDSGYRCSTHEQNVPGGPTLTSKPVSGPRSALGLACSLRPPIGLGGSAERTELWSLMQALRSAPMSSSSVSNLAMRGRP
jgi:hypothetical protein